jgi:hypothetical protein
MDSLLQKIESNELNKVVLDFLGYSGREKLHLLHFDEVKYHTHEVREDFLKLNMPSEVKYILNTHGIFVHPKTGEIFAFQFWRTEMAFKNKQTRMERITSGLFRKRNRVQNYFSNDAGDDIIDATELGSDLAIHINFIGSYETMMISYYNSIR